MLVWGDIIIFNLVHSVRIYDNLLLLPVKVMVYGHSLRKFEFFIRFHFVDFLQSEHNKLELAQNGSSQLLLRLLT